MATTHDPYKHHKVDIAVLVENAGYEPNGFFAGLPTNPILGPKNNKQKEITNSVVADVEIANRQYDHVQLDFIDNSGSYADLRVVGRQNIVDPVIKKEHAALEAAQKALQETIDKHQKAFEAKLRHKLPDKTTRIMFKYLAYNSDSKTAADVSASMQKATSDYLSGTPEENAKKIKAGFDNKVRAQKEHEAQEAYPSSQNKSPETGISPTNISAYTTKSTDKPRFLS